MKVRGLQRRLAVVLVAVVALLGAALVAPAGASRPDRHHHDHGNGRKQHIDVRFSWLRGYDDPGTPDRLDRVGVVKVGPSSARDVLVLNPGTSAGGTYFVPLAK